MLKGLEGGIVDEQSYETWWCVDGGEPNVMGAASDPGSGCVHKLAMCDVTGWSAWGSHGGCPGRHGPFQITFVACAKAGGASVTASRVIYTVT